jgi:hypothetical protein
MTHLGEPQFAAGISAAFPEWWAVQPWVAGMDARLGQMNFGSITSSLFNIAKSLSQPFWTIA